LFYNKKKKSRQFFISAYTMDLQTIYEEATTSWGPDTKDSMPRSPTLYAPLARPVTPPTFTQPEDVFDGVASTVFVDTIKASVATLLNVVIGEYIREKCIGCEINHPSQRRHPCLYDPPRYYFFNHFEELVKRLWSCRFIPALVIALESMGIAPSIPRVYGVTEAFLHELKEALFIHEKLKEIRHTLVDDNKYREAVMADVMLFWLNKSQETE
jgi:hypothetical protein